MGGLGRRYPHQLSGGQQQRGALARALTVRPSVVLLDEPFGSLDASLRTGLRRDVARVLAQTNTTTVLVTHDQNEALALADRIAVLRQGRMVVNADPHELYRDPPDLTAATSIGEANILPADVQENRARCVLGTVRLHANGPVIEGPAHLLLRPEQLVLHLERGNDTVSAVVVDAQFHGHDTLVDLVIDDPHRQALLAAVPGDLVLSPGQPVWVEVHGRGRVWSIGDQADGHGSVPIDGRGGEGADESLWIARPGSPRSSGGVGTLVVPGPAASRLEGAGNSIPPKRSRTRLAAGIVSLGVAVLVVVRLLGGGSSPSAIGPVVFHESIAVTGEITAQETYIDATTAEKCSGGPSGGAWRSAVDGPQHLGRAHTTPQQHRRAQHRDEHRGYHGPGHYAQSALSQGNGVMGVGPETYDLTSPDATASMTVNADGSGTVAFTHVPGDDDKPHPGLARRDLGNHRLDLHELRSQPKKNSAARGEPPSLSTGHL